jgi:hypothetical protein
VALLKPSCAKSHLMGKWLTKLRKTEDAALDDRLEFDRFTVI